jgi:hypothetical protein
MLGIVAVVAVGIIGLLLMVGVAVAVVGLGVSAVAGLYYAVRRKLAHGTPPTDWRVDHSPAESSTSIEVHEIEVEVLPQSKK